MQGIVVTPGNLQTTEVTRLLYKLLRHAASCQPTHLVDEVHQAAEVDAGVVAEAHLAGAAGGVAVRAAGRLQVLQRPRRQLRVPHPPVARHACASPLSIALTLPPGTGTHTQTRHAGSAGDGQARIATWQCSEVGAQERGARKLTAAGDAGGDDLVGAHSCQLGEGV